MNPHAHDNIKRLRKKHEFMEKENEETSRLFVAKTLQRRHARFVQDFRALLAFARALFNALFS